MKVILLQEVENLGEEGEIVSVKNGYGRNFLIPRGMARLATKGAVKAWEEERRQASRKIAKRKEDAEELKRIIESLDVVVFAKVGEEGRIFGSVTTQNVADGLAAQGVDIDKKKIEINEEIRMIGVYSGTVKIHGDVSADVTIKVEPEVEA